MNFSILTGDALAVLRTIPAESVQCVCTSPPFWGLRDYGVEGQLGLEKTPEEYVGKLVEVFREVRRVLRKDGTVWLNLGDSYNAAREGGWPGGKNGVSKPENAPNRSGVNAPGLKPKDLVGIPWRVAFALQADGWWLRSDIIWAKPNPMPESVTDRPTKAHEYIFLLTKSASYYFDQEAVRECGVEPDRQRLDRIGGANGATVRHSEGGMIGASATRNIRSVWTIATQPFPEAHFATFPEALAERCIKAGTSEKGCCATCGTPWERVVERGAMVIDRSERTHALGRTRSSGTMVEPPSSTTIGWRPGCFCGHEYGPSGEFGGGGPPNPIPCTVLDPFCGSGTAGAVAVALQRNFIGIELNPKYVEMANRRIGKARRIVEDGLRQQPLFGGR